MSTEELSNSFDTLLNSYNIQAGFGEGSNKQGGITLDEYEKSVLLTQAQDFIVKSYFDRTLNNQGQGFDDSMRRQVDFSSLIKVHRFSNKESGVLENDDSCYDERGLKVNLDPKVLGSEDSPSNILFILNERLEVGTDPDKKVYVVVPINYREYDREMSKAYAQPLKKQAWRLFSNAGTGYDIKSEIIPIYGSTEKTYTKVSYFRYTSTGWMELAAAPTSVAGTVTSESELSNLKNVTNGMTYEVDEETTAQDSLSYVVRYVERPKPIVLRKLPNGLSIDGVSDKSECLLNPILHMDILNKAFELAVTTRGGGTAVSQRQGEDNRSN